MVQFNDNTVLLGALQCNQSVPWAIPSLLALKIKCIDDLPAGQDEYVDRILCPNTRRDVCCLIYFWNVLGNTVRASVQAP